MRPAPMTTDRARRRSWKRRASCRSTSFPEQSSTRSIRARSRASTAAKVIANYAKAQGWNVIANLNNDIVGNSCSSDGVCNSTHIRIFSEGPRWQGHEELAAQQRSMGGENDAPGRNISRYLDKLADRLKIGLDVRQIWRNDRFGRGGDHTEFLNLGFPAVRFTVAVENYNWQHQDIRTENGIQYGDTIDHMDFAYLAKVAKLNIAALAGFASAPPPPEPKVEGAVSTDTTISWPAVRSAVCYTASGGGGPTRAIGRYRGSSTAQIVADVVSLNIRSSTLISSTARSPASSFRCKMVLPHIRVDDWVFGVSSVSRNGFESAVASAVPGGAFNPYIAPPKRSKQSVHAVRLARSSQ